MCAHSPGTHANMQNTENISEAKHVRLIKYGRKLHIFLQWGLVFVRSIDSQRYETKLAHREIQCQKLECLQPTKVIDLEIQCNPNKNLSKLFSRQQQTDCKVYTECSEEVGKLSQPYFKTYCKATITRQCGIGERINTQVN